MPTGRRSFLKPFFRNENGSVLIEVLITAPVLLFFTIGILEFGNIFWQRHQLATGVRDAARYWSRCQVAGFTSSCSPDIARNIAFYGNPAGTGGLRVPGWNTAAELVLTPATRAALPSSSGGYSEVRAAGNVDYQPSPLLGMLEIGTINLSYTHVERYIGW